MQSQAVLDHRPLPVDLLQADIRRICGAFDVRPMRRDGMADGAVTTMRVGFFDTAIVALDGLEIVRDAVSIRRDPGEHFFLLVQKAGRCRIAQGEENAELEPGDMFLVDSTKPSSFLYNAERSSQLSLHIPRAEVVHRFGNLCAGGLSIARDDPLRLAIQAVLNKLLSEQGAQPALGEAFLCLVGAYLHSTRVGGGTSPAETLLSRALSMIDRRRADPTFGPGALAASLNVSERMLQRSFRPLGETPGHRLLHRRLELARERLTAGRAGPVMAVALDCGFNDLSYFHREFRKKYGMTPGACAGRH